LESPSFSKHFFRGFERFQWVTRRGKPNFESPNYFASAAQAAFADLSWLTGSRLSITITFVADRIPHMDDTYHDSCFSGSDLSKILDHQGVATAFRVGSALRGAEPRQVILEVSDS